jgi:hypothetical protein
MTPRIQALLLAALLASVGAAKVAQADLVMVDGKVAMRESSAQRPARGMTMRQVEERFGAPSQRRGSVGQPPITRWDYAEFSVYFEYERVLHAVAGGA